MAHTVSGLFSDSRHAESAVGALRADGIRPGRISVAEPGRAGVPLSGGGEEHHGMGGWLAEHLLRRHGQTPVQEPQSVGPVAEGGYLVTVSTDTETEERDVRTAMVAAGAEKISNATDGTMIPVQRPEVSAPTGR